MGYTQAQNRATQKYIHNNYDQIVVRVKKGDRDKYRKAVEKKGISLNEYLVKKLDELL